MSLDAPDPDLPPPDVTPPPDDAPPIGFYRVVAFLEVLICSDYPTQLAIAAALAAAGVKQLTPQGTLALPFIAAVSLADTAVLVGLILLFLHAHGERPRDVFLGPRRPAGEVVLGLFLAIPVLILGAGLLLLVRRFAPWLHTVEHNPLEDLIRNPRDAWLFAIVVVIAGGVREEIQRAFLLHRFDVWLGGGAVGVVVTSIAFGAGHFIQGADAAIATGTLGAFWAIVYLKRRSLVAPMVSHAGFNLLEIVQYVVGGTG